MQDLVRGNWPRVILVLLIAAEPLSVLGLGFQQSLVDGGFQYGCTALQSRMVSNDSMVSWVLYTCPSGAALYLTPSRSECAVKENACTRITPTFTAPPGLLSLFLVAHDLTGSPECPQQSLSFLYGPPTLVSGRETAYTAPPLLGADYCAQVQGSTARLDGFTIAWSLG